MPRPSESTAALMLRASAEKRASEANVWTARKGASLPEGPLDSLKAMTERIEGLGKGLVELAEGRPQSARRSVEALAKDGDGSRKAGLSGSSLKKPAAARLEELKEDIDDDGSDIGSLDSVSGFKSSLPPSPFKY